jgi:hypothetical protein
VPPPTTCKHPNNNINQQAKRLVKDRMMELLRAVARAQNHYARSMHQHRTSNCPHSMP